MTYRRLFPIAVITWILPSLAYGYGEGSDIPEGSRIIHLLTNEARTNTKDALASCGKACSEGLECHSEVLPPLYWDDGLYRAAQFHSNMLNNTPNTPQVPCVQHYSPCTLNSDVAAKFPKECDGSPSCACTTHQATCNQDGTTPPARVMMFADSFSAENLASALANPYDTFMLWLYEDGKQSGCEQNSNNGHRFNILGASTRIGVGYALAKQGNAFGVATQDFSRSRPSETPALTAGAAYSDNKDLWFKTHYYSKTAASKVTVTLEGAQTELNKTRGTDTNGVYGSKDIAKPAKCAKYYFEATDTAGTTTRFPTTGYLLYQCESSWQSEQSTTDPECKDDSCQDNPGGDTPENPECKDGSCQEPPGGDTPENPECQDGNCQEPPGGDTPENPECQDGNCQEPPSGDTPENPECQDGNCQEPPSGDTPENPECTGADCGSSGSVNLINNDHACSASPLSRPHNTLFAVFAAASLFVFLRRRKRA